jgi:hypothetical protein
LLVVITALATALVTEELRYRKIEAELEAEMTNRIENQRNEYINKPKENDAELAEQLRRLGIERIIVD